MEWTSNTPLNLRNALHEMAVHPIRTLVPPWSWKAAALAATVRGLAFFVTNVQVGRGQATKALVVEAIFAFLTGGAIGAISQQLRKAEPLWATAAVVWVGLPGVMLLAQSRVHRLAHTPHLAGGLVLSSLESLPTWLHDLEALPRIFLGFLIAGPRHALAAVRKERSNTKGP